MGAFWDGWIASESADKDSIHVKRLYIDINDGNAYDAILFSQIMYWHGYSEKTGKPRMTVEKDGHLWIAKSYDDWWDECRIKADVARKAIDRMVKRGLLIKKVYRFNTMPTTHIRVNVEGFEQVVNYVQRERIETPLCYNVAERDATTYQNGMLQRSRTLTETTTKTTTDTEKKKIAGADAPAPNVIPFKADKNSQPSKPMTEGQQVTAIINAWWDELKVKPGNVDPETIYKNRTNRRYAANMLAAGVTPVGVRCFVKIKTAPGAWYHDKALMFGAVAKDAPVWCRANASQIELYERINGIERPSEPGALPLAAGAEGTPVQTGNPITPEQRAQAEAMFAALLAKTKA